ncbi:MAG: IreB family regulatory phosphoprotein [Oscillospiraceae bacterium]|nr:IreB family regulatory phosphoprotein [Oscillospiraceae bacterium]
MNQTLKFDSVKEEKLEPREIILSVYAALVDKGYNPINQIVGYILSGDPSYITAHNNARSLIRKLERDEILEELVKFYVKED